MPPTRSIGTSAPFTNPESGVIFTLISVTGSLGRGSVDCVVGSAEGATVVGVFHEVGVSEVDGVKFKEVLEDGNWVDGGVKFEEIFEVVATVVEAFRFWVIEDVWVDILGVPETGVLMVALRVSV